MAYRAVLLVTLLFAGGTLALAAGTSPTIYSPSQVQWTAGTGPLAGTQVALLYGDPAKPGPFVMRIRVPNGAKFAPHFHPVIENVTVLQGTLLVGLGDKMNMAKMVALPAGAFVSVPPNVHHYAVAKGDTIIQLNDSGPWAMTAVKTH
jgi:quercetin dioxygenase-like cupin family protein